MADSENINFLLQCLKSTHTKPDFDIVGGALNIEASVARAWFDRLKNTTQSVSFGKTERAISRFDVAAAETWVANRKVIDQSNEGISRTMRKRKRPRRRRVRQDHDIKIKYDKEVKDFENQSSAETKDDAKCNTHTIFEDSSEAHDSVSGTESSSGPHLKDIISSLARKELGSSSSRSLPRPTQPRKKAITTTSDACRPSVTATLDQSGDRSDHTGRLFSIDIPSQGHSKHTSLERRLVIQDELEQIRTGSQVQLTCDTSADDTKMKNISNHNINYPAADFENACDVQASEDMMNATNKCSMLPDEFGPQHFSAGDGVVHQEEEEEEVVPSSDVTSDRGVRTGNILRRITSWFNELTPRR